MIAEKRVEIIVLFTARKSLMDPYNIFRRCSLIVLAIIFSVLKGNIDLVKDSHRLRAVLILKYMNIMMIMGAKDVL